MDEALAQNQTTRLKVTVFLNAIMYRIHVCFNVKSAEHDKWARPQLIGLIQRTTTAALQSVQRAIEAGVRSIEHGHLLDEETLSLMARENVWLSTQVHYYM